MINFNEYLNEIDFSELKKYFLEKGKPIEYKKKDLTPASWDYWLHLSAFSVTSPTKKVVF